MAPITRARSKQLKQLLKQANKEEKTASKEIEDVYISSNNKARLSTKLENLAYQSTTSKRKLVLALTIYIFWCIAFKQGTIFANILYKAVSKIVQNYGNKTLFKG